MRPVGKLRVGPGQSIILSCLFLLIFTLVAPAEAQADVTIGYQVVKATGPGSENRWLIYMKIINNGDEPVDGAWVRLAPPAQGTASTSNPPGWTSATTTDSDGVRRGAIWGCSDPADAVQPGTTKTGYVWEVESENPPGLLMGVVNYTGGGADMVPVTKVVVQTENQACEDPENHGFQRDTSSPGHDWLVIPDSYFQFEDCVLAVGDVIASPDHPYVSSLQTPLLDLTDETEPSVQFTSLFESDGAGIGRLSASPDGGASWLPIMEMGFECTPATPCAYMERQIVPLPALAGVENAVVRWEFQWEPGPMTASWIVDDIVVLGDSRLVPSATSPRDMVIAMAAPSPNPFAHRTQLAFRLTGAGHVRLGVFDLRGRRVRTLVDEHLEAGPHSVHWNGRDETGRRAAAGTYLARLEQGGVVVGRKISVLE